MCECHTRFVSLAFWWGRLQVKICSLMEVSRSEFAPWLPNFQLLSNGDQLRHQQHRQPLKMSSRPTPTTNYVIRNGRKVCRALASMIDTFSKAHCSTRIRSFIHKFCLQFPRYSFFCFCCYFETKKRDIGSGINCQCYKISRSSYWKPHYIN